MKIKWLVIPNVTLNQSQSENVLKRIFSALRDMFDGLELVQTLSAILAGDQLVEGFKGLFFFMIQFIALWGLHESSEGLGMLFPIFSLLLSLL